MTARQAYNHNIVVWSDIQDHLPLLKQSATGNVMEIGVRSGMSTSALLAGVEERGGHVYSVDINNCPIFQGHPQWSFMVADSIRESERIRKFAPDNLELLFVDGDHTYEGCLADLTNYGDRAKKILIHDCECPLTFPGVRKACEHYSKVVKRDFYVIPGSYGMGVIE